MIVRAYDPVRGKMADHVLSASAIAAGVTIASATEMRRCEWCGVAMTPLVDGQPHRTADDQIRVPGQPWPTCVRCGRLQGLLEPRR